ncbi:MAG TPA: hypothetical protein VF533_03820, partial [Solirubrobacteraceae bacterium]
MRGDLGARILAAIPAIAFAIFIVERGGAIFAAGVLALAFVCLHELFSMYARVRPVRLAALLGVAGMVVAAAVVEVPQQHRMPDGEADPEDAEGGDRHRRGQRGPLVLGQREREQE